MKKLWLLPALVLLLALAYLLLPGFTKRADVYVDRFALSGDGSAITLRVGVGGSVGAVRKLVVHQQFGGKLYLKPMAAFGGINGAWGAKSEFTLPLDPETEIIALYQGPDCYETVLIKTEDGWERPALVQ